ncbi:MAG: cytochrome c peroxidase [Planctomycetota bacterium]|jgi:cytochrome c peroxidase
MSLMNVAYNTTLTWSSLTVLTLEDQIRIPLFNQAPVEIGLGGKEKEVIDFLRRDNRYTSLFTQAFPEQIEVYSVDNIIKAIAAFVRTLMSGNSSYDRLVYKNERAAISESVWRGMRLFFSEETKCAQCHQGFNFSGPVQYSGASKVGSRFHNTGLYNIDGKGAYPEIDQGLIAETAKKEDMGKFRAPTLRNVEYSAPYMHDGSIGTLEAVIDHYAKGGRHCNPFQDSLLSGFDISEKEKQDLVNFLKSLSDKTFIDNPRFSDPELVY